MRADLFDKQPIEVPLDEAAVGDPIVMLDVIVALPPELKVALEKELKAALGEQNAFRVAKAVKAEDLVKLSRKNQLRGVIGEVVE